MTDRRTAPRFDRLARIYRGLELLAFGHDLERARFTHLHRLAGCRDILVLGEGDGRCLERLRRIAPAARIRCIDASAAMLARARTRLGPAAAGIEFEHGDVFAASFADAHYDAVVTCFFLDCFTADQVRQLVTRIAGCLRPGAMWLFADFAQPASRWARIGARTWLTFLYAFFRWETGIEARALPPSGACLEAAGLHRVATAEWRHGFIRSDLFVRPS